MRMKGSYASEAFIQDQIQYEISRLNQAAALQKSIIKESVSFLDYHGNKMLLDVGCGTGIISDLIHHCNTEGKVIGIDREEQYISYAKKHFQEPPNIMFYVADCLSMDFPDNYFDICFSRMLFQHLPQPDKAICELKRVTKPGGLIAICDINKKLDVCNPEPEFAREYLKAEKICKRLIGNDIHIGEKAPRIMEDCGLQEVAMHDVSCNTNNSCRKELSDMVRLWRSETSEEHPYIKTGLISYDKMIAYLENFQKIILDEDSFVNFGYIFVTGRVIK